MTRFTYSVFICAEDCECQYPAAIAQLAARRSHNPKVVSSILTRRIFYLVIQFMLRFVLPIAQARANANVGIH